MANIKETLTLVDRFSNTYSKFVSFAQSASGESRRAQAAVNAFGSTAAAAAQPTKALSDSLKNYASVGNALEKKLINLNAQWDAMMEEQERLSNAGLENTKAFSTLDNKIMELASTLRLTESQFDAVNQKMQELSAGAAGPVEELQKIGEELKSQIQEMGDSAVAQAERIQELESQIQEMADGGVSSLEESLESLEEQMQEVAHSGVAPLEDELESLEGVYQDVGEAAEESEKKQNLFLRGINKVKSGVGGLISKLQALAKQKGMGENLSKQLNRFALSVLSVSKIINTLKQAMEYAPEGVQESWQAMSDGIRRTIYGGLISALQALQPHFELFEQRLNSPAGQKFMAGLMMIGNVIGSVIGYALEAIGMLVEVVGNDFSTVMTIATAVLALFAAQMLISAAAAMLANLPLLLLLGIVAAVILGLQNMGMTAEQIFTGIGMMIGWLYAFAYNIVADIWNLLAVFGEFFAGFLDNPVAAIGHLIADLADWVLSVLETLASGIDALFGSNLAGAVGGWRDSVQSWADSTFGAKSVSIPRMEKISFSDAMGDFGKAFGDFGKGLDNFDFNFENILDGTDLSGLSLGQAVGGSGGSGGGGGKLGSDVAAIKKEVAMSDEELKSLVDLAERKYVNNINLTAQTPVINITGQNTGNVAADRRALANAIRDMLIEQQAASSLKSTAMVT